MWGLWQRSTEFMARSNCRLSCRLGQVEVTEGVVGNGDEGLLLEAQPASDEATASPADTCPWEAMLVPRGDGGLRNSVSCEVKPESCEDTLERRSGPPTGG